MSKKINFYLVVTRVYTNVKNGRGDVFDNIAVHDKVTSKLLSTAGIIYDMRQKKIVAANMCNREEAMALITNKYASQLKEAEVMLEKADQQ